eukprot:CAMPEP_0198684542 /NCGR_PEP_ID=MMETSP1468-20131203/12355_1 /TAXON_ID=1461545 /ORGANISM="Mantoniella sp, Strain CCMP1436" /LENGTH=66 /DNA_ID=CAMNT_0044429419 /DNA_START=361 /DNA_END=561 /DNA_ORIENTATION=+
MPLCLSCFSVNVKNNAKVQFGGGSGGGGGRGSAFTSTCSGCGTSFVRSALYLGLNSKCGSCRSAKK